MMNAVLDLHPEAQLDATIDAQIVTVIALLELSIVMDCSSSLLVPKNFDRSIYNLMFFVVIGRRYRVGDLNDKQIRDLMPTISDEHAKLLLQVEKMRALPGGEILEHIPMVNTNTTDNGNRMITELTTMTKYLTQHRFSRNWRKAIMEKIAEIQPIVDDGRNTMETREAFQWLHQNYYRIREEYEQAKNRAERSPNLDRQK
ncbi:hypothetical protein CRE_04265 [Caenorhabditis remanei]|uniref:FHA domain-containing protein n=1 Tax=Caenorhabditis remanei TaxID=31234 RepID=E3NAP8_CAERE|nr:hypothetical protein CRE_04265 [Caenorhabditis remanei]